MTSLICGGLQHFWKYFGRGVIEIIVFVDGESSVHVEMEPV